MTKKHTDISVVVALAVLAVMSITAHGETAENINAFCAFSENFCSNCRNICGKQVYKNGYYYYTSDCGEYCKEFNGTIVMIDFGTIRVSSIRPEIGSLTGIKTLSFRSNLVTELPQTIGSLYNLEKL